MEDGIFPSYMTITADDPEEVEEERRLCYVGITRAEEELTLTCARRRMIRGETQYNKMSRFLKEIPMELLSTGAVFQKSEPEEERKPSAYQQARQAFRAKAFVQPGAARSFGSPKGEGPGYQVGDRVRHVKFGEGTVTAMVEGGRDYEVTVDLTAQAQKRCLPHLQNYRKLTNLA